MNLFPENVSTYGQELESLFWSILVFAGVAFVLSLFLLLYPLSPSSSKPARKKEYMTGESKRRYKLIATALGLLLVGNFAILYVEHHTCAEIESTSSKTDVHIGLIARQSNWIFVYPGPDGVLGTSDDVVIDNGNNPVHVPINANVIFELPSQDAIRSFYIADVRLKQDSLPGKTIIHWFIITKPGKYDISCTQVRGLFRPKMINFVQAETPEKYKHFTDSLYNQNKIASINK
jgi:heme/copper-type cytochrome/quinol oxidase subunit 2